MTPVLTRTESNIDFDWVSGSPDASKVSVDKFGAVFSGKLPINYDYDVILSAFVDDGVRIYIDGELDAVSWKPQDLAIVKGSKILKSGKTYEIRVEFFEDRYGAQVHLRYDAVNADISTVDREVWIPEGEWINTFTGEVVYGPRMITVSSEIEEMPLFVKKGAILPLADEMLNTTEKDWSHLTLDVYPSTRYSDSTQLFEDDTISSDYTEGKYRTTEFETYFDKNLNKTIVKIGAASGSFDGDLCFTERDWTVRVHQPENWGALKSATLADGTKVSFTTIAKDADAMPFAGAGGSPDGTVYVMNISGSVSKEQVLHLVFENPVDSAVPNLLYDSKIVHAEKISEPKIVRSIAITQEIAANTNLTEQGTIDWIHSGSVTAGIEDRKAGVDPKLTLNMVGNKQRLADYITKFSWSDGSVKKSLEQSATASYTASMGSFELSAKAGTDKRTLTVYFGGYKTTGDLVIYDDSEDFITDYYQLGSLPGNFYLLYL
jgi:hypothetical protein